MIRHVIHVRRRAKDVRGMSDAEPGPPGSASIHMGEVYGFPRIRIDVFVNRRPRRVAASQAARLETLANAALTARSAASGPKATPSIVITSMSVTPINVKAARR